MQILYVCLLYDITVFETCQQILGDKTGNLPSSIAAAKLLTFRTVGPRRRRSPSGERWRKTNTSVREGGRTFSQAAQFIGTARAGKQPPVTLPKRASLARGSL